MRGCLGIGGLLLAVGSLAMIVTILVQAPEGGLLSDTGAWSGTLLLAVTCAVGLATAWYIYGGSSEEPTTEAEDVEVEIVRAARERDGRMTVAELSAASSLEEREAGRILERLVDDDYVRTEEGDGGETVYIFPDIDSNDDADENELLVKLANVRAHLDSEDDSE